MNRLRALGLVSILGCSIAASCGGDDTETATTMGSGGTAGSGGAAGGKGGTSGGSAGKATGGSAGKATGGAGGSAGGGTTGGGGGGKAGGGTAGGAPDAAGGTGGTGGTGDASTDAKADAKADGSTDAKVDAGGNETGTDARVDVSAVDSGADVSSGDAGSDENASTDAVASDATDAAPQTSNLCAYQCQTNADCLTRTADGGTHDDRFICHPVVHRCERLEAVCETHDDCAALASLWTTPCASDSACDTGEVCVDAGGYGRCAPLDGSFGCFPFDSITRKKFRATTDGGTSSDAASDADAATADGGDTVAVCGSTTGRCNEHKRCFIGCADDSECTAGRGEGRTCNTTTGLCECTATGQCTKAGVSTCNTTTHHCECTGNGDCTTASRSICVQGACGCSGAQACTSPYAQATSVCE